MSASTLAKASADLLVLSGPSCAGKTGLLRELLEARPLFGRPVTTTTRPRRSHERDGVDYHFMSDEAFERAVERGEFIEHQFVHGGRRYGLSRASLDRVRADGRIPAVILDVQGALQVREELGAFSVFLRPGSISALERRIREMRPRAEADDRIRSLPRELAASTQFDAVVRNPEGEPHQALSELLEVCDRHLFAGEPRRMVRPLPRR